MANPKLNFVSTLIKQSKSTWFRRNAWLLR